MPEVFSLTSSEKHKEQSARQWEFYFPCHSIISPSRRNQHFHHPGRQSSSQSPVARSIRGEVLVSKSCLCLASQFYRPQGESNTSSTLGIKNFSFFFLNAFYSVSLHLCPVSSLSIIQINNNKDWEQVKWQNALHVCDNMCPTSGIYIV